MTRFDAVLFDLDGTLLDIDFDSLMRTYLGALGPVVAPVLGVDPKTAVGLVLEGTEVMMGRHPGLTNKAAFDRHLLQRTGVDISAPEPEAVLAAFYDEVFPTFGSGHGPFSGTRAAVEHCLESGVSVGIATQPLFPARATRARMEWAGLGDLGLDVVSTYENSYSTKPRADYFKHMAERVGARVERILMVGDDPEMDMAAGRLGMTTWYVGAEDGVDADHRGPLDELVAFLRS